MSSGFISETELAERRRIRQEEWEKVRKPDQPIEAPEEEYDHRSLFERLQEQKQKREFEFEEAHRLKHMIKGLDDDEIEFLDLVDRSKLEEERKKSAEEAREMADFRNKVKTLQEQSLEQRIQNEIKSTRLLIPPVSHSGKTSQTKLLAGVLVKKKSAETQNEGQKRSTETQDEGEKKHTETQNEGQKRPTEVQSEGQKRSSETQNEWKKRQRTLSEENENKSPSKHEAPLQCIGILPGLTSYDDSSDSASSDTDSEMRRPNFDLLGRKVASKPKIVSASQ